MRMLFLGIVVWVNFVYSLRVAVEGLFTYGLLQVADDGLLDRASAIISGAENKLEEGELRYMQRLILSGFFEMLALFLEMVLMGYLLWHGTQRPLALAVLLKDVIYIGMMLRVAWRQAATGVVNLLDIKEMPQRSLLLERAGYLFSAAAMGWLLYSVVLQTSGLLG
ncbi:MAG: hypothetical protein PHT80_14210 [Lentisphaeria bacterium]|nr:hypothetical protein [Lentisphaeria bacterium]